MLHIVTERKIPKKSNGAWNTEEKSGAWEIHGGGDKHHGSVEGHDGSLQYCRVQYGSKIWISPAPDFSAAFQNWDAFRTHLIPPGVISVGDCTRSLFYKGHRQIFYINVP